MIKWIIILLVAFTCSAQKMPVFTYNYTIENGVFTSVFTNTTFFHNLNVGSSTDVLGIITFSCREDFSLFFCSLYNWGNTSAHIETRGWNGLDLLIGSTHFILQRYHPYILIVDNQGRTWKLTKAEAFALGNALKDRFLDVPLCNPCNCTITN